MVKEDLANVGSRSSLVATEKSAVGANDGLVGVVSEDVNVRSTTGVVTRDDRLELSNTVDVGLLDATEKGSVEVGGIIRVAVTRCCDTGVLKH